MYSKERNSALVGISPKKILVKTESILSSSPKKPCTRKTFL